MFTGLLAQLDKTMKEAKAASNDLSQTMALSKSAVPLVDSNIPQNEFNPMLRSGK